MSAEPLGTLHNHLDIENAVMIVSAMDSQWRLARERNVQARQRIADLEQQLRAAQESWHHEQTQKCSLQASVELLQAKLCDVDQVYSRLLLNMSID